MLTDIDFASVSPAIEMVDGEWSVFMRYTTASGDLLSSAVTFTSSCSTLPPQISEPTPNSYQPGPLFHIAYYLPSVPLDSQPVSLLLYNSSLSIVFLMSPVQSVDFVADSDLSLIELGGVVQSVSPQIQLFNGSYNLSITYSDNHNHPPISSLSPLSFQIGPPPPSPVCPPVVPIYINNTIEVPYEVIVNQTVNVTQEVYVYRNVTVYQNATCPVCPEVPVERRLCEDDYVIAGHPGIALLVWVCVLSGVAGVVLTMLFFICFANHCTMKQHLLPQTATDSIDTTALVAAAHPYHTQQHHHQRPLIVMHNPQVVAHMPVPKHSSSTRLRVKSPTTTDAHPTTHTHTHARKQHGHAADLVDSTLLESMTQ
jgi:hypothetical protein